MCEGVRLCECVSVCVWSVRVCVCVRVDASSVYNPFS